MQVLQKLLIIPLCRHNLIYRVGHLNLSSSSKSLSQGIPKLWNNLKHVYFSCKQKPKSPLPFCKLKFRFRDISGSAQFCKMIKDFSISVGMKNIRVSGYPIILGHLAFAEKNEFI